LPAAVPQGAHVKSPLRRSVEAVLVTGLLAKALLYLAGVISQLSIVAGILSHSHDLWTMQLRMLSAATLIYKDTL